MLNNNQPQKRKIIDWNKKSDSDSVRISKRMQGREGVSDAATTNNVSSTPICPPRAVGEPLMRLRQKIKEIYDEEDAEENSPLFNIELFEDLQEEEKQQKTAEIFRITKQMELAGKLNLAMNTALIAEKAGMPAQFTAEDSKIATTPEYDMKKVRRHILKKKIEEPLKLKGELPEKSLPQAAKGLNKAIKAFGTDSLKDFPAENADMLDSQDEKDIAKLIFKKTGRKTHKQSLSEIAKGLNKINNIEEFEPDDKENN